MKKPGSSSHSSKTGSSKGTSSRSKIARGKSANGKTSTESKSASPSSTHSKGSSSSSQKSGTSSPAASHSDTSSNHKRNVGSGGSSNHSNGKSTRDMGVANSAPKENWFSRLMSRGKEHKIEFMKFFEHELQDLLSAENQLVDALPEMAEAATAKELASAFKNHLKETESHVKRLNAVFMIAGLVPSSKKCRGMRGLIREGEEAVDDTKDGSELRDAALIIAAQKVEHYEIAAYGSLRTLASLMGLEEAVELLENTLAEEKRADEKLTQIAQGVNIEAYTESANGEHAGNEKEESLTGSSSEDQRGTHSSK